MFDNYRRILDPPSILDVVDPEILRSLMQGFFYRQMTGVVMLYDNGQLWDPEGGTLNRLEPFPDGDSRNQASFHPFCKAFRKDPQKDSLCCTFDKHTAALCYDGRIKAGRIKCHMGLSDFVYPIQMGNRVRAVLFAGQRVPAEDSMAVSHIERRIRVEVAEPAAAQHLIDLLPTVMKSGVSHQEEADELKNQFFAFGETFQKTVTAVHQARRGEALHEAILMVSERLNSFAAPDSDDWVTHAEAVLTDLESLCGGLPLVFLVRTGSRYVARAVSPLATQVRGRDASVVGLATLPPADWTTAPPGSDYSKVLSQVVPGTTGRKRPGPPGQERPPGLPLQLYRFNISSAKDVSLSAILLTPGSPGPEAKELLAAAARAMAYPAYVSILFGLINAQREKFVKDVTFTGHTLKTPITTALFLLHQLEGFANGLAPIPRHEICSLARNLRNQLLDAVFDARALTAAAPGVAPDWVDVGGLLRELIPGFQAMGEGRSVTIKFDDKEAYHVRAIRAHLRIAFNNLLDNAVKYSFSNREVRIEVLKPSRGEALIEISNYGLGFEEVLKSRLFTYGQRLAAHDPRRPRHGSGLGLVLAKDFIEGCNGSIDMESRKISDSDPTDLRHLTIVKVLLPIRVEPS